MSNRSTSGGANPTNRDDEYPGSEADTGDNPVGDPPSTGNPEQDAQVYTPTNEYLGVDDSVAEQWDSYRPQFRDPVTGLDPSRNMQNQGELWTENSARGAVWGTGDQIIQLKVALARAGYYNLAGGTQPNLGSALVSDADVKAMELAMGDSNVNGWGNNGSGIGGSSEFDNIMAWLQAAEGLKLGKGEDALERLSKTDAQQSLRKWLWDNGLALPEENVKSLSEKIRNGGEAEFGKITDRLTKQYLIPTYPAYAEALKRGETMADLSAPYKSLFSQVLEVAPESVDLMDPVMQKAMQGIGEGERQQSMPLWEFKEMLKQDKRWQYTDNAWDEVGGRMSGLMEKWGMM